MKSNKNC